MGKKQCKKDEIIKDQNTASPSRGHNSSTTQDHNLTQECDELIETGFRRWIIKKFSELKECVLTQCKEPRKRIGEMLTRINSLEKYINDLMELKNTAQELREAYTSFNSQTDQAEEKISEIEDQSNEIK